MEPVITPDTDRDDAVDGIARRHHALEYFGTGRPWQDARPWAVQRLAPAFAAADAGHEAEWDPPAAHASVLGQWTCRVCHASVQQGATGRLSGEALKPCPGPS